MTKASRNLTKVLSINWKLHCAYRSQSSGQTERMNRTLEETMTKLVRETGASWATSFHCLLRVQCVPYWERLPPFEAVFGRPPPILPKL